jgi:GGDEF domain-containing protein
MTEHRMSDLELIRALARATAALADPDARPDVIERVLAVLPVEADLPCELRLTPAGMDVVWHGEPGAGQRAFVEALGHCVDLAAAVVHAGSGVLDRAGLLAELHRTVAAARWRGDQMAVAVFDVRGLALRPGVDASDLVGHLGAIAREVVRHDDVVGHLGAGRFALIFPRAGTFEARAAYRRVRAALMAGEHAAAGISCGSAGFADLTEGIDGDELLTTALERLAETRRRRAYIGPVDPLHPLAS